MKTVAETNWQSCAVSRRWICGGTPPSAGIRARRIVRSGLGVIWVSSALLMGVGQASASAPDPAPINQRVLRDPLPLPSSGSRAHAGPRGQSKWVELNDYMHGPTPLALLRSDPDIVGTPDKEAMTPSPTVSFDGVMQTGTSVPPDTNMAVGPGAGSAGRVVMVTNESSEIWDKTGTVIAGPTALGMMFTTSGPTFFVFDPKVLYDQHSGRFFIVCLELDFATFLPASAVMHIAVSTSSTPSSLTTADWIFMSGPGLILMGAAATPGWVDYPGIGADDDALFVTTNMFSAPPFAFLGANIRVFDKSLLIAGTYAFVDITYDVVTTPTAMSIQPAHVYGTTDNGGFYLINRIGMTTYRIYNIVGDPATPVAATGSFPWSAGAFPMDTGADQCTVATPDIDTLPERVMSAVYRGGHLWCCMTEDPDLDVRTEVVWQDISTNSYPPTAPTITQSGFIDGTGTDPWTYMPSINVNSIGDAVIGFTQSSATECPGVYYASRYGSDPLGTFQKPVSAIVSAGFYDTLFTMDPERWGDYSSTVVDPDDDCFWIANEYVATSATASSSWGTRIASFCTNIGACCLARDRCAEVSAADCSTAGGDFRGQGTQCPDQNVVPGNHQGLETVHWSDPNVDCYAIGTLRRAQCIPGEKIDAWVTARGPDQDTCHEFGDQHTCSPPIPADFFEPGSGRWEGSVCLEGVPLAGACLPSSPALPQLGESTGTPPPLIPWIKPRMISFSAGDAGASQAIRVTFTQMPPGWGEWVGQSLFVQEPWDGSELGGVSFYQNPAPVGDPTLRLAQLDCNPYFTDWSVWGDINVIHPAIAPSKLIVPAGPVDVEALYTLQVIDEGCSLTFEPSYSDPLVLRTAAWADVAELDGGTYRVPGDVVSVVDTLAMVSKFAGVPNAPSKASMCLLGVTAGPEATLDGKITISETVSVLGAFGGTHYPFLPASIAPPPGPCPLPDTAVFQEDFGDADTLIWRSDDPFDPCGIPTEADVQVGIQIMALSLQSKSPMTVMVGGQETTWDVDVDLSTEPQPMGALTARKTHCNGGTYLSDFEVQPRFTFTKVSGPGVPVGTVQVLDTGLWGLCPVRLVQDSNPPWAHAAGPDLHLSSPYCTGFHPAIEDPIQTTNCDCNDNLISDKCDIDSGFSPDANGNGIPDECEDGACCHVDDTCSDLPPDACAVGGGVYKGPGTVCLGDSEPNGYDDACEPPGPSTGACCRAADGGCFDLTSSKCERWGGSYQGDGTTCLGDGNGNGIDDACEAP